ncbi:MAG: tRNA lysidine(34) synthetase TilS [Magnetococcus sp. YQC-5]
MTFKLPSATDPLILRLRREAGHLFPNTPRTVAAVSGGADSLALMYLLLASGLVDPHQVLIAHFDHGLRPDSQQDAHFTRDAAHALGLPWVCGTWSSRPPTGNLAALARTARYAFLQDAARQYQASHLACGHHLNDQAETFMERLVRGSGPRGLAAMAPARSLGHGVTLVRPLLFLRHQEITSWLTRHGFPWREDPSNQNTLYLRSRIRHQLLPSLQEILGIDPITPLANAAKHMARTNDALEWTLDQLWPTLDLQRDQARQQISLSWSALAALPEELMRRIILRCHQELTGSIHAPGSRASSLLAHMMQSNRHHWSMAMQGLEIRRVQDRLLLTYRPEAPRKIQKHSS